MDEAVVPPVPPALRLVESKDFGWSRGRGRGWTPDVLQAALWPADEAEALVAASPHSDLRVADPRGVKGRPEWEQLREEAPCSS